MKTLLIEDEQPAVRRLEQLLREKRPGVEVLATIDSVEGAVRWLQQHPPPELIFMDIQLADGLSFDIFTQVELTSPVIFTTAYDQYTLRAFKVNSVDYLLKPIDPEELAAALEKFDRMFRQPVSYDLRLMQELLQSMTKPTYKERFLVKAGQQITYLPVADIRYFYSDEGLLFARTGEGKRHHLDYTLEQLEDVLDPQLFFRLNRKVIAHIDAIHRIEPYFNSRLILELRPKADFEVIVSRDRVNDFKGWLDR